MSEGDILRQFISLMATVFTLILFCTGIPICRKVMRKGSAAEVSHFPFLIYFWGSVVWCIYGYLKMDSTLIFVNFVGILSNLAVVGVCYSYTVQKGSIHRQLVFSCALITSVLLHIEYNTDTLKKAQLHLGLFCSTWSVITYASPLSVMREVIRTKSTAMLPFGLCSVGLIVSTLWMIYGMVTKDPFLEVPNAIGSTLSLIQVTLFCIFPGKRQLEPTLVV